MREREREGEVARERERVGDKCFEMKCSSACSESVLRTQVTGAVNEILMKRTMSCG